MFVYFSILLLSSLIAFSSNSIFVIWAAMEVSILALLPLLINYKISSTNESLLKYFLIQIMGGLMFLAFSLSGLFSTTAVAIPLLLKLGLFPFYLWVPHVFSGLSFNSLIILSTIQKFPPLIVLSHISFYGSVLAALLSIVVGSLGGVFLNNFKKILAFSSISHSGWMVFLTYFNSGWCLYLITYSFLIYTNFNLFSKINFKNLTQWSVSTSPFNLILFWTLVMSLAGLPPLMGFSLKWISLSILVSSWKLFIFPLLISFSLALYFYLNMFLISTLPMSNSKASFSSSKSQFILVLNLIGLSIFFILV